MSRERFTASERHRLSLREKWQRDMVAPRPPLYRCRLCSVKVLGRDQAGHSARAHSGVSHGWDLVTA